MSKDNFLKRHDGTTKQMEEILTFFLSIVDEDRVTINFIGEIELLPCEIQNSINMCKKQSTADTVINLAIVYDPISDAKHYLENMDTRTQIDLVIRTGKEKRSSGFFPLQTLYSEWVYSDTMWPDFTLTELYKSLDEYMQRTRRFGA
jgi:undecaprenyl pyrophosphate synthase